MKEDADAFIRQASAHFTADECRDSIAAAGYDTDSAVAASAGTAQGAWQAAGVWAALHRAMLEQLQDADALDWSRAALDSVSLPARGAALQPARTRRIGASRG